MATVTKAELPGLFYPPTCSFQRLEPIQIWSLVAIAQTFPLAFSVSIQNQGSLLCSYTERLSIKLTPCWSFISNGNKRYDNSVLPTNPQMPGHATTAKKWLLSQKQNSLKGMKLKVSPLQKPNSNWTYHLCSSSTDKKSVLV